MFPTISQKKAFVSNPIRAKLALNENRTFFLNSVNLESLAWLLSWWKENHHLARIPQNNSLKSKKKTVLEILYGLFLINLPISSIFNLDLNRKNGKMLSVFRVVITTLLYLLIRVEITTLLYSLFSFQLKLPEF